MCCYWRPPLARPLVVLPLLTQEGNIIFSCFLAIRTEVESVRIMERRNYMRVNPIAFPLVCIATLSMLLGQAPKPATPLPGDWPMFSHDLSSTRFSPLTQISAKNVQSSIRPGRIVCVRTPRWATLQAADLRKSLRLSSMA